MTRQVAFLHTELQPKQRMLKHKAELEALGDEAGDIYVQTKLETYLNWQTCRTSDSYLL